MGDLQERLEEDGHNYVEDDGHGADPLGHGDLGHAGLKGEHEHDHPCNVELLLRQAFFCTKPKNSVPDFQKLRSPKS